MMASGTSKTRDRMSPGRRPPRQAQDGVELPARFMDLERELLDQAMVFVVVHIEVLAVFAQHFGFSRLVVVDQLVARRCSEAAGAFFVHQAA